MTTSDEWRERFGGYIPPDPTVGDQDAIAETALNPCNSECCPHDFRLTPEGTGTTCTKCGMRGMAWLIREGS